MGRIIVSENVTLDGVMQDPTGEEGIAGGHWFTAISAADQAAWAAVELAEAANAKALLLGRRSDAWFGERWNDRPGEWADRLRELPKYVVSSTIEKAVWVNGTVLAGDPVDEIWRLKEAVDGDIVVYASGRLVPTLFANGLVDELRLTVFPMIAGAGAHLFAHGGPGSAGARGDNVAPGGNVVKGTDGAQPASLRRVECRPLGESLTYLVYRTS